MTLALVVISVTVAILYFTSKMIIKDKKAYLFDNVFSTLENDSSLINQFIETKRNQVLSYQESFSEDQIKLQVIHDYDLYQIRSLTKSQAKNIHEKSFHSFDSSSTLYTNRATLITYRGRENFLSLSDEVFAEMTSKIEGTKGIQEKIYFELGSAPRYLIVINDPKTGNFYCFDFLIDRLMSFNFGKQSLEIHVVNKDAQPLYQNRPYDSNSGILNFFKQLITEKKLSQIDQTTPGVQETKINNEDYIIGFRQINRFPEYFIFSTIKTIDAYEVTTEIIINAGIFALCLIAFFNFISIILARSITNPLDKLTNVIKSISDGEFNARVGQQSSTELQVVGDAFNDMINKIEQYREKLIEYNKNLEQKVEERTAELKTANIFIKSMVDSLAQGLMVFDRRGKGLSLYTKACEKLLGTKPSGKNVADLIKASDKEMLNEWIKNLFEEMIPFESLVELGQKSIPCPMEYTARDFKHITLEFFPMRDEESKIQNVILVASDKTKEFKASKEIEAQKNYIKLVSKALKDKANFMRFVEMFNSSLQEEFNKIKQTGAYDQSNLMRLLHSMKGSAAFYSLQDVVDYLHHFETDVTSGEIEIDDIPKRIENSIEKLNKSVNDVKELMGSSSKKSIEIVEDDLYKFNIQVSSINPKVAHLFTNTFLKIPVENYINQYKTLTQDLAIKLGKDVNPLIIEGGDIRVDRNYFQEFFDSCIHLFRNTLDHGIESPDIRQANGKSSAGNVIVRFELIESKLLQFSLQDDGKGIDPNRIRQKLTELNYPQEEINKPDSKIIYHIFDSSFSTAESVTELSGRGVGLYDIKMNVEKMNGSIEVVSKVGSGTCFTFLIPVPEQ
ncbi:MAG: ATP-binding protein [Bacteriovoracaceae bacterium]